MNNTTDHDSRAEWATAGMFFALCVAVGGFACCGLCIAKCVVRLAESVVHMRATAVYVPKEHLPSV